ncbi:hypothetical protein KIN20_015718 [Parelaphostrongylus tenuis]|uniref:Uncharacterized protein n=1 Tax=Parelaphostrongylus tenuis TaxID=148309 RepID=A0AAD5MYV2_PARTN|nr:hypothetical protein KIN20_015718 [Parelaphostrongylus tenuis]
MGRKATETTRQNNALASTTAKSEHCNDSSRNFVKETRALKMKTVVAGYERSSEMFSYAVTPTKVCPGEFSASSILCLKPRTLRKATSRREIVEYKTGMGYLNTKIKIAVQIKLSILSRKGNSLRPHSFSL